MNEFVNGIEFGFGISMIAFFLGQGCRVFMSVIEGVFGRANY